MDENMTEQEVLFFKQLEEQSKDNPIVRIQAAADYITGFLKQAFTTPNGIQGDAFCYMLATMAGVAVANSAKENHSRNALFGMLNPSFTVRSKVETKAGIFWGGDDINKYLFNSPLSVWNIVMMIYSQNRGKENLPDLQQMVEENASNMGNPDARVWNDTHNPYREINNATNTYTNLLQKLEPYKLQSEEYVSAFAISLGSMILHVESVFPKGLDCLRMSMETTLFYAHMDV